MSPEPAAQARVRELRADEVPAACRLAAAAFRENRFYQEALGLDPEAFDAYWDLFLPLAMDDSKARVHVIEDNGAVTGLLVVALGAFPAPIRGLRFLGALLGRIGPRRLLRYLRFVAAYDSAMHRPRAELRVEARGLWLLVSDRARHPGLGTRLVHAAVERSMAEGKTLFTGLVDAGHRRLLDFYRRAGFTVGTPFRLGGGMAATIEMRARPRGEGTTCRA
jgi:ribosomal protein S18 acetylase RimI-like enzyme